MSQIPDNTDLGSSPVGSLFGTVSLDLSQHVQPAGPHDSPAMSDYLSLPTSPFIPEDQNGRFRPSKSKHTSPFIPEDQNGRFRPSNHMFDAPGDFLYPSLVSLASPQHITSSLELGLKLGPPPSPCRCGSSINTSPPSTVALYSLAVTMAPKTRKAADPKPTTSAAAKRSSRPATRKRKADSMQDDDDEGSAPAQPAASKKGKGKAPQITEDIDDAADQPAPELPPAEIEDLDVALDSPEGMSTEPLEAAVPRLEGGNVNYASRLAEAETRAAMLEKELRQLKKYKLLWYKAQQDKAAAVLTAATDSTPDDSIPRPPGDRGKHGWNLQTAMGLEADGDMYNAILAAARDAVRQVGLDWRTRWKDHDPARLTLCYSQMKKQYPFLRRFENSWACRELTIGVLQNKRKVEQARTKALLKNSNKAKRAGSKAATGPSTSTLRDAAAISDEEDEEDF